MTRPREFIEGIPKLIAPNPEDFNGIDQDVHEPLASDQPDVGWLSPDGVYYPSGSGEYYTGYGNTHYDMAEKIVKYLYPEDAKKHQWSMYGSIDGQEEPTNTQLWLVLVKGWLRTDYGEDWLVTGEPTQAQIRKLYLLRLSKGFRFNPDEADRLLAKYVRYL